MGLNYSPAPTTQQAMLKFTQINLHKAQQATLLLGQEMEGQSQVISLVTEPHTTAGKITGLPRGTTVVSDKSCNPHQNSQGPRAGIVADRGLIVGSRVPAVAHLAKDQWQCEVRCRARVN